MTDRPVDGNRPRPPDARRRFRRRLLLLAVVVVVAWTIPILIMGLATGYWSDPDHPRGLMGAVTVTGVAAVAVAYRRVSRPVGDLLGAAVQVGAGDYGVDIEVRGPRDLRLLTQTFNEMADRLAANEEQRRRFLADITHELRNPLAVLQSRIEAQMDGVHPRDDHHLALLLAETRRLGHLVDDLHTLALAEAGRLVLRREPVAFGDLVDEVVPRHSVTAARQGVALHTTIQPGLPKVWVDPVRI